MEMPFAYWPSSNVFGSVPFLNKAPAGTAAGLDFGTAAAGGETGIGAEAAAAERSAYRSDMVSLWFHFAKQPPAANSPNSPLGTSWQSHCYCPNTSIILNKIMLLREIRDKGATVAWSPFAKEASLLAIASKEGGGAGFDDYGGELQVSALIYDFNVFDAWFLGVSWSHVLLLAITFKHVAGLHVAQRPARPHQVVFPLPSILIRNICFFTDFAVECWAAHGHDCVEH